MGLRIVEPRPAALRDLDELVAARHALIKDRTAALNREKQARHKVVRRLQKSRLALIGKQIQALDAEIAKTTAADEELARRNEVLTSIPGVGPAVAATLLSDMPELGRIDGKAAGSLVGAAPRTRESGQWKGRSFIRGGRAGPRRMLYMAALSAIRHNPDMARKLRRDARPRQAGQGRPDCGHAQAGGAGQRAAEAGPTVDPGARPRLKGRLRRQVPTTTAPFGLGGGSASDRSRGRKAAAPRHLAPGALVPSRTDLAARPP